VETWRRGGIDGELQLGPLAVLHGQVFHQKRGEAGTRVASEAVEDGEAPQTSALVSQLADPVQHQIHDLLADGVVTSGVVVGGILLSSNQLLGVGQLAVGVGVNLDYDCGLQVHEDGAGHVFVGICLAEEC